MKRNVLIFIDWYLPGNKAGGPVKSIVSLTDRLKDQFNFLIVTTDTDFGDDSPYPGIRSDQWIRSDDSTRIYYFSKKKLSYKGLKQVISGLDYDVVYINSYFSKFFSIYPLLLKKTGKITKPVILAPRGMLGSGALELKSAKKKGFILMSKLSGLHNSVIWQATSDQEHQEISKIYGKNAVIKTVQNLSQAKPVAHSIKGKISGELRLFFLSRISPKKNLSYSLRLLSKIPSEYKVIYDIFGPMEDPGYWEECCTIINHLPPNIKVNYRGEIKADQVQERIRSYHFLLLCTLNENFGHAIVESFLSGCPVIISDQTPWKDLEAHHAGWDISLEKEGEFLKVLTKAVLMDEKEYAGWSQDAIAFAVRNCIGEEVQLQTISLFSEACPIRLPG